MKPDSEDLNKVLSAYRALIASFKTVLIASTSTKNIPEASYAPYLELEGRYYIFISELAVHTQNLLQTHRCSLLFIEDEVHTNNLFARQRVSLQCTAENLARDSRDYQNVLDLFHQRFGKLIALLQTLPDFHLFCLTPNSGNYVAGFGKAYSLSGSDLGQWQHRNPESGKLNPNSA
ncbi:HugZ family protein [Thiothrix eikelboomii]|uniref:HugZ family pyridoxamine 5'-phosphate oxidase n=1 Tax=Thiothrix eikelboomii TaxID=92487 RepID=UPI003BAFBAC1